MSAGGRGAGPSRPTPPPPPPRKSTPGPARVPFSPNARDIADMKSYRGSVARYRTTFSVAQPGSYAIAFESVNHRATVWVDGRLVARHTGDYLPFEARVALRPGRHRLA